MGPAGMTASLMPSLPSPPQPLQTLLGPEAPALWLAWPQGSWFWSARCKQIQPPRLSGTEMVSCCRYVPGWGPRDISVCPCQAPDPDQTIPAAEGLLCVSTLHTCSPGVLHPYCYHPI